MDLFDLISYVGLLIIATLEVILMIKYFLYWKQLEKAFKQAGIEWPGYSQNELREKAHENIFSGYRMIAGSMAAGARIIFSMRTNDPIIRKPLRGIRRTLIAFFLVPLIVAPILVMVLAFIEAV